jgi:hypothetical protein
MCGCGCCAQVQITDAFVVQVRRVSREICLSIGDDGMLADWVAAFASTLIIILGVPALTTPCELSQCKVLWELPPEDDCAWRMSSWI